MSQVSWIKIRTDMFSDEKIRLIEQLPDADSILVIWVKLLALAGQKNANGEIFVNDEMPYTDEMLAAIFHRKVNVVRMALETFQRFRMIEISTDQTIIICNWAKHQNVEGLDKLRLKNQERKKRWRERQLEQKLLLRVASGGNVPMRDGNVPGNVPMRDAERLNCVPQRDQIKSKKEKREEVPSAVSLKGRQQTVTWSDDRSSISEVTFNKIKNDLVAEGKDPADYIIDPREAKILICERILDGKDPTRPWSDEARQKLIRLLPMPRREIERVAWFKDRPDDGSSELSKRQTFTETGLLRYWSDEVTRADAYWERIIGWREKLREERKKEPPSAVEERQLA